MAANGIDALRPLEHSSLTGKPASLSCASPNKPGDVSQSLNKALQEVNLHRASSSKRGLGLSASHLSPAQKARWQAAAKAVTQKMRGVRYSADHSTFSALNVDGIAMPLKPGSDLSLAASAIAAFETRKTRQPAASMKEVVEEPLKQQLAAVPDSEAETTISEISSKDVTEPIHEVNYSLQEQGRCTSLGRASTESGFCDELHISSEGEQESSELGDFFKSSKSPKQRSPKGQKAAEATPPSSPSAAPEPGPTKASIGLAAIAPADVRGFLLSFRTMAVEPAPERLQGFSAQVIDEPLVVPSDHMGWRQVSAPAQSSMGLQRRQISAPAFEASGMPMRQISAPVMETPSRRGRAMSSGMMPLMPSEKAYRPSMGGKSPMDELRRTVKSLLNKVCPESVTTIAAKIGEVEVRSAEELQDVISLIFQKALSEPHYCATYADLVFGIKSAFPEFPTDNGKPQTFKTLLLDVCQKEFESLPTTLEPSSEDMERFAAEELEFRRKATKDRLLANMKLIGHLFLRQMLSPRVIGAVIEELTLCHGHCVDRLPEGHCVECAVELLLSIGHTLEALPIGKQAIVQVCARLLDLKQRQGPDGRGVYCKRIQFAIQDLFDVRAAGWARKVFGGVARTKEEIRMEQMRDLLAQARGKEVESGQVIISGQRPEYIEAAKKN